MLETINRRIVTTGTFSNATPRDFSEPSAFIGITANNYFDNARIINYSLEEDQVMVTVGTVGYNLGLSIEIEPETQYTVSYDQKENNFIRIGFYDEDGAYLSYMDIAADNKWTFTSPENAKYMNLCFGSLQNTPYTFHHPIMVKGSTIESYTPYANVCMPEGFNIWDPIEQEYIQVYAGYVNANTRELYLRPVYQEYAGEELVGPWMSSLDPYEEDTTPTEGAFVIDFGGELESFEITPFMLQTLLDSLGIRQHFTDGAELLNKLMDQAQGRVRSEEELLHLSRPLKVIAIGDQLPAGISFKPISKDVLPGLPGKFIR